MKTQLPYVIECNMGRYFEPIAAFNSLRVAQFYAHECSEENPNLDYRVIDMTADKRK